MLEVLQRAAALALLTALAAPALAWEGWPLGGAPYQRRWDVPPSFYGYPLDDTNPTYFGGINYREYYGYGRGHGLATFPGPLPSYPYGGVGFNYYTFPKRRPPAPNNYELPPPLDRAAHLGVHVPADAELWLEGNPTQQTGTFRRFVTPLLEPGERYEYELRARWQQEGKEMEQVKKVVIRAGERISVSFPAADSDVLPAPRRLELKDRE